MNTYLLIMVTIAALTYPICTVFFWEEVARRRRLLLVLWTGMMAWTL